jgi:hypothetical protein
MINDLIKNQRKNINKNYKLSFNDLKRISKNFNNSIFDKNNCSLWKGSFIKNNYINIFHNNKRVSLHRLLYINYIDDLNESEYIKFLCDNKGKCCNVYHIDKHKNNNIINDSSNHNINNIQNNIIISLN